MHDDDDEWVRLNDKSCRKELDLSWSRTRELIRDRVFPPALTTHPDGRFKYYTRRMLREIRAARGAGQ